MSAPKALAVLGKYADRTLPPINALSASKLLLQKNIPDKLTTQLGNACRALDHQVLDMLEIACEASEEEVGEKTAGECMAGGGAVPSSAEVFDAASPIGGPTRH